VVGLALVGALLAVAPTAGASDPRGAASVAETPGSPYTAADPVVALTFDDGPDPTYTPPILAILAHYQVNATFFEIGRQVNRNAGLVAQIAAAGNSLGGHTWDHVDLEKNNPADDWHEIGDAVHAIQDASGQPVVCTRPPSGSADPGVLARLAAYGQTSVVWSVDTYDWKHPGVDAIVQRALGNLHDGTIILMHDGGGDRTETIAALPAIIEGIEAAGFRIVPICGSQAAVAANPVASSLVHPPQPKPCMRLPPCPI
jgi:peptidoglycan/xylan/chitin deacetylase (PgdA/CDA1 family)